MTALFWEYDTRTARRWNLDPVDQISISNYAVNGLNPILYSDPEGDLFGIKGFGSTSEQRQEARAFAKAHVRRSLQTSSQREMKWIFNLKDYVFIS